MVVGLVSLLFVIIFGVAVVSTDMCLGNGFGG